MLTNKILTINHHQQPFTDITMGADPEWVLVGEEDNVLNASELLRVYKLPNEEVGCDGTQQPQAELRPRPHVSPVRVVINMVKLLNAHPVAEKYAAYKWMVGAGYRGVTVCGHIHFGGMDSTGRLSKAWMRNIAEEDGRYDGLLELLDEILLPFSILLSNPLTSIFDTRKLMIDGHGVSYGALRGIRKQPHGAEYRTLPSWLYSPEVALFFMATAKAIAIEKLTDNINIGEYCERPTLSGYVYKKATLPVLWSVMRKRLPTLIKDIQELSYYRARPELLVGLEVVERMIHDGVHWDGVDVRKNWLEYDVGRLPKAETSPPPAIDIRWLKKGGGVVDIPPDLLERLQYGETYRIFG